MIPKKSGYLESGVEFGVGDRFPPLTSPKETLPYTHDPPFCNWHHVNPLLKKGSRANMKGLLRFSAS